MALKKYLFSEPRFNGANTVLYHQVCLYIYTQSKKDGCQELSCVPSFGLEVLYSTLLRKTYSGKNSALYCYMYTVSLWLHVDGPLTHGLFSLAHRALPDVEALEELFNQTSLQRLLWSIPIRSTAEQLQHWEAQKECYKQVTKVCHTLPTLNKEQARKLVKMGLTYEKLCHMCATTKTKEEFKELLKMKGITRGKLHNELVILYPSLRRRSQFSS